MCSPEAKLEFSGLARLVAKLAILRGWFSAYLTNVKLDLVKAAISLILAVAVQMLIAVSIIVALTISAIV